MSEPAPEDTRERPGASGDGRARRRFRRGQRPPRLTVPPYSRIERLDATPGDGPDPYGSQDPEWLRIDWREHLRSIDIEGATVNYAEIGDGAPIVFVHGLAGCWQNWLENMPYFAASGYRAIALDLPGFGSSPLPPWEISIERYGVLVDEFCRRLNLHACALVGNSMGGFVAAEVAHRQPEWVQKLVLVSAAGITHAKMRREPAEVTARMAVHLAPLGLRFRDAGLRRPGLRQVAYQGVFRHPQRLRPELLWEFSHHAVNTPGFVPAVLGLVGYDFLDLLERISVPTLIVWGRDDLIVPSTDAYGYHERISDSEVVIFEDCGHVPMAERPTRFNRVLQRFLEVPQG